MVSTLMIIYQASLLVTTIATLLIGVFVYSKNRRAQLNRYFILFTLCVALWGFCLYQHSIATEEMVSLSWARALYIVAAFIPVFSLRFILLLLGQEREKKWAFTLAYTFGLGFLILNLSGDFLVKSVVPEFPFNYRIEVGTIFPLFILMFFGLGGYGQYLMVRAHKSLYGFKRNQVKYVFWGLLFGYIGVATTFLPILYIQTQLLGILLVLSGLIIFAACIAKYRLMDITIIINKTTLFIILIGGLFLFHIGFVALFYRIIGYGFSTMLSGLIMLIGLLSPGGRWLMEKINILIYTREKYNYRKVLKETIEALVTILTLDELLYLIVNTIVENIGVRRVSLLLMERGEKAYKIKASYAVDKELVDNFVFPPDSRIISWLKKNKTIFIKEERERSLPVDEFRSIYNDLDKIGAELIIPISYKENLVGILNLDRKNSGDIYDPADIDMLNILSSEAAIAIENARLYTEAITDGLTALYNHRYFQLRINEEVERAKRYRHPVSLLMIDIDDFKDFNDHYGHQAGNEILRSIGEIIKSNTRIVDIQARYGGEEFAIILPETTSGKEAMVAPERLRQYIGGAIVVAERIKKRMEESKLTYEDKELGITVSIGVACFDGMDQEKTKDDLIREADEALYKAKALGKNRVYWKRKISTSQ